MAAFSSPANHAKTAYRGRFAPSPTGPLHFGSLIAAVGSYLDARANGGEWLVRIDDIDTARCSAHWADDILRTLEAFGFEWDGEVVYQSRRTALYAAAVDQLARQGTVFACSCTRKEIADSSLRGIEGPVYPGVCRRGSPPGRTPQSLRLLTGGAPVRFDDLVQGPVAQDVEREIGDFVVRRADGPFAYQLAVVVDDAEQRITRVVRGADLLMSTPRQILLQSRLGYSQPDYAHLPVATDRYGAKLSKQTGAPGVHRAHAAAILKQALDFLGQRAPDLALADLWVWARENWRLSAVPPSVALVVDSGVRLTESRQKKAASRGGR